MRGGWEPSYPLLIKTEGAYSVLEVVNPTTGEVEYTSKKFYKKNAKKLYEEDSEFRGWFDHAVDYSCRERISRGLLKIDAAIQTEKPTSDESDDSADPLAVPTSDLGGFDDLADIPTSQEEEEPKPKKISKTTTTKRSTSRRKKTADSVVPDDEDTIPSTSEEDED